MSDSKAMLDRLMMGKSSDYDVAFYHHEKAEASMMRDMRTMPFADERSKEFVLSAQAKAHAAVLQAQGNTQYHLYHPAVVHGTRTNHLFNRDWKSRVPKGP